MLLAVALCSSCGVEDADTENTSTGASSGDDSAMGSGSDDSSDDSASADDSAADDSSADDGSSSSADEEGVDCSEKTVVTTAFITDFEGYDGGSADTYEFNFNGDEEGNGAVYAGLFLLDDESGSYSLEFIDGADGSQYALSAQNPAASEWGGGFGVWHGCMDASSFTGIQFMAKGSTPAGTGDVTISMANDLSATAAFNVPADWTLVQLPFSDFEGDAVDGSEVGALAFAIHLIWVPSSEDPNEWVPEEGPFELTIDDLSFY
jgi:hypothetical protein